MDALTKPLGKSGRPQNCFAKHFVAMIAAAIVLGVLSRRWFHPSPISLCSVRVLVIGLLWLSERFQWFGFNCHKGWTVLIAVAASQERTRACRCRLKHALPNCQVVH